MPESYRSPLQQVQRGADRCRLCGESSCHLATMAVLGGHVAELFQCPACGYAQFASPHWLEEAYRDAITSTDLGLLQRCIRSARRIRDLLAAAGMAREPVLDWGGGYGTLTRLLRDRGIDCWHWDPHCRNLFARGFESSPDTRRWGAVVALEVFEHLVDPWKFLNEATSISDLVIFSTDIVSEPAPPPGWHYYAVEHGQHVGFLSRRALAVVGRRTAMRSMSLRSLHVLSRGIGPMRRLAMKWSPIRRLAGACLRTPSLLPADYRSAIDEALATQSSSRSC